MTDVLYSTDEHEPQGVKTPKKAAIASFVGSMVEYYDFFVYGVASALVFPKVFFNGADPKTATLLSFATFGVAYVARPVGGLLLGHFGDRLGRRAILVLTLLMMGASTFAVGLIPSYASIGVWAPILLVACRLLQGFSAGGEQAGASSLTLEHAPADRRAYFTSFTLSGTQAGQIASTSIFIPFSLLPDSQFLTWGWRIPFFLSAIVVAVGFWVRRTMPETPAFEQVAVADKPASLPIADLLRRNSMDVVRVAVMALVSVISTLVSTYGLGYGINSVGLERIPLLFAAVAANVVALLMIPYFARLSDRIGRRPVFIGGALGSAVFIFVYLRAMQTGNYLLIVLAAIALSGVVYSAANGVWPAFYAEQFSTKVRYSGMAIGTQIGFAFSGFAPSYATSIEGTGASAWVPVAIFGAVCSLLAAGCALFARETFKVHMLDLGHAAPKQKLMAAATA